MTTDKERIARLEALPEDFKEMKTDVRAILTLLNDPEKGVVHRLADVEDIVSPFVKIRNKIWGFAAGGIVGLTALTFLTTEYIKTNFLGK